MHLVLFDRSPLNKRDEKIQGKSAEKSAEKPLITRLLCQTRLKTRRVATQLLSKENICTQVKIKLNIYEGRLMMNNISDVIHL